MRHRLLKFIKTHNKVYDIYFWLFSFLIRCLGLLVITNKKMVLFVSYGGKSFSDSPGALFSAMQKDSFFEGYQFIWAFREPEAYEVKNAKTIKIDTISYFIYALKAGIWVTNSAVERGLRFKKKSTVYLNTWHGTPLKKIGTDAGTTSEKTGLGSKNIYTQDLMIAQSEYDQQIFSRVFGIPEKNIIVGDLPRNERLTHVSEKEIMLTKEKLGFAKDQKIILYAPTYREFQIEAKENREIESPIHPQLWDRFLEDKYVVIYRGHYEMTSKCLKSEVFYDLSDYEDLNDLLIISDVLISDYSSIYFDYSLLEKPMFCYPYDLGEYKARRGLYIELEQLFPGFIYYNETELLEALISFDRIEAHCIAREIKKRYVTAPGEGVALALSELKKIRRSQGR